MIPNNNKANDQPDQKRPSSCLFENGILMDVFYDLILEQKISSSQLFWLGNVPSDIIENLPDVLRKMSEETMHVSDVILFTSFIVQCVIYSPHQPDPKAVIRREIMIPVHDCGASVASVMEGLKIQPGINGLVSHRDLRRG
jgi:hypothetical protein